ncbi:hypothetical protein [Streptococcus uberis]|uniref:hypothetical protein n=1 Tax=Streptococcus uberis TaxID=1349 RepID=UPI001FF185A4|nr:hypothetical protein [Streptococcus uberis]MCK1219584.1 hypothetical protein [Streptococcus uberis]
MMKIYHGNSEHRELVAEVKRIEEAFFLIDKRVRASQSGNALYYRQWMKNGERVIDYGSYRNYYYIVF